MVTTVSVDTTRLLKSKGALTLPCGTKTKAGTGTASWLAEMLTLAPPVGAGWLRATVPWIGVPPAAVDGVRNTEETYGPWTNGLIATKPSDTLLVSFGTRLVEVDAKPMPAPPGAMTG